MSGRVMGTWAVVALSIGGCGTVEEGVDAAAPPSSDAAEGDGATVADAAIDALVADAEPAVVDAGPPDAMPTWSGFTQVAIPFSDHVMLPLVSTDGRTLYFMQLEQPSGGIDFDVYVATRAMPSGGFGAPAPLPGAASASVQERYPDLSSDGLEVFFTDGGGALRHATRSATTGTFGASRAVGVNGNFPSISGDRRSLYYVASTGQGADGKIMRVTRAEPGQAWSTPSDVPVPVYVQLYAGIDISEDELSIVIAPAWEDPARPGDVVVGRRNSLSESFSNFTTVAVKSDGFFFNSARWGTGDTEIWVGQLVNNLETPFVSQLR